MDTSRRGVVAGLCTSGLTLGSTRSFAAEAPVVLTQHGPVRGFFDNGVCVFKGVRYGAPTQGRRFQPPLAPAAWSNIAEATAPAPSSVSARIAVLSRSEREKIEVLVT